jgi:hypothetical protein
MLADVGNLVQRINGARIDGAGAGYDRDWEVSILPILTDSIVEGGWVHPQRPIMLHASEVFTTDAHQLDCLLVTAMAFASGVELQLRKYPALRGSGCRSRSAPAWRQRVPSTPQSSPHSRVIPCFPAESR